MAKTLQFRRGTTAELSSVTGAIGELFVDTEKNTLLVHDGTTGHELVAQDGDATLNSALIGDVSIVGNTVSGVDSYGNADALVVEGDLTVRYDTQVTTSGILVNGYTANSFCYFTPTTSGSGIFNFNNSNNNGWPEQDLNTLATIQPGTVVNFTDLNTGYGNSTGSFIVVSSTLSVYYGSPILNMTVSNISVNLGTNAWVVGGTSISNVNWTWSTTSGSIVDVLDVTETGVDITGSLTVNGQAITAGSGGSSYDQSLNTTDDVVFNSALVGDVSIVGNTVSGVDSYGNADTLVVGGDLTVRYDTQVTTSGSLSATGVSSAYGYFGSETFTFTGGSMGYSNTDLDTLDTLEPGAIVQFTDLSTMFGYVTGSFTVVSSTKSIDYYGVPSVTIVVSNITVTSGGTAWLYGGSVSQINWTWVQSSGNIANVLDVTSAGVDITGTLTVNGQAITAGSSYDQDLNTTDDVVFNSALVGDVSIVGNTVSGVDSYGNADTLVVEGGLQVAYGSSSQGIVTTTANVSGYVDPYEGGGWYADFYPVNGFSSSSINAFLNLPAGSEITLYNIDVSGFGPFYKGVYTKTTAIPIGADGVRVFSASQVLAYTSDSDTSPDYVSGLFVASSYTYPGTVDTTITVLDVTETGVDITGALTVNGQSVANYDQDLNTTDDVVFNSALVGDVSIVGNTVSGVDSYGNADTLVVDGNLNVQHASLSTISYPLGTLNWFEGQHVSAENTGNYNITAPAGSGSALLFYDFGQLDSNTESILSSLTSGQQITLIDTNATQRTYTVVGTAVASGMGGSDIIVYVQEPLDAGNIFFASGTPVVITTTTIATTLSVTNSAVSVDGDLQVNGGLVPGFNINQTGAFDKSPIVLDTTTGKLINNNYIYLNDSLNGRTDLFGGSISVNAPGNTGTRTALYPSSVDTYSIISGTAADGGYVHRKAFGVKTGGTNSASTTVYIAPAATLNGDISVIEITVSAVRVDSSSPPSILQAKSWKLRGYATKLNDTVSFSSIGTAEVLIDTTGAGATVSPSVGLSIISGGVRLTCEDQTTGIDWTWGGEYTVTTTHVLVPAAGGGGGK